MAKPRNRVRKGSDEVEADSHPSEDSSGRFPDDQLLRHHGFHIVKRKRGHVPTWSRDGQEYTEAQALEVAFRELSDGGEK